MDKVNNVLARKRIWALYSQPGKTFFMSQWARSGLCQKPASSLLKFFFSQPARKQPAERLFCGAVSLGTPGSITLGDLTLWSWSSFSSCLCPSWSNFRWSVVLLYANFDGLWWAWLLPKLLLYLGKIGLIGLELNSEGNNFSFICSAKQRTILLGVPRAWRVLHDHRLWHLEWSFLSMIDYNLRSFCKHPSSMQHFFQWLEDPVLLFQRELCIIEQFVLQGLYFFVCSWWRKVTLMIWKDFLNYIST